MGILIIIMKRELSSTPNIWIDTTEVWSKHIIIQNWIRIHMLFHILNFEMGKWEIFLHSFIHDIIAYHNNNMYFGAANQM